MMKQAIPILIAFIVTVLAVSAIPMLGLELASRDPSLSVHTHGHDVEARQALLRAGIPGLRFVEKRPIPHEFFLLSLASAPLVAFELVIFFGVFCVVQRWLRPPNI